jgi:hypothetical integral membrane protein (TIGR02206 family)
MRQFSDAHFAALAVLLALAAGSVWAPRRRPGPWVPVYCWVLALAILAGWAGEYVADALNGSWTVKYTLPLQLTDAISLTAILALWSRRRLAVELVYFWALTASVQATITPDLGQDFPSLYYFTYFTYHIGAVVAACLLVFGCGIYPRPRAAWRVFGLTLAFAAIAGVGDLVTGGNYMYLRAKPSHNSLLNVMGPWPWYLATTALLALAMLLALAALADLARRADSRPTRLSGAQAAALAPAPTDRSETMDLAPGAHG